MNRCLIVDDSSVIRKVAKRIIASRGITVIEAATAQEALRYCRMDMPETIIADITLPDMETRDFISQVRAIKGRVRPVVSVLINEMDVTTVMRCKRAGADAHMFKPFNRELLLRRLDDIFAEQQAKAA
ncbi:MAG: response regulator [Phyllobacteriaceae bacterium]|nr:response regulator [Phyllobacteriaceae bacterium]